MPARGYDHDQVRRALMNDGWTITHDPLRLRWGVRDMYVDLGAERLLAAEKGLERIEPDRVLYLAVSETAYVDAFEDPLGQLLLTKRRIKLLVYNPETEAISQWTPEPPTAT